MKNKRRLTNLVTLCLISLLVFLTGCGVPVPGTPTTEPPPVTERPPTTQPPPEQPPPPELEIDSNGFTCEDVKPVNNETQVASNGIFVDNQLLLQGPREILEKIAAEKDLTLLRLCNLNYLSNEQVELVIGLYEVKEGVDPQKLSDEINKNPDYKNAGVTADPNYLVSPSAGSCADPYSDGGSPSGTLNPSAGKKMFLTQWAPKSIGVTTIQPWTGWSDVHVVVFDTMPKQLRPALDGKKGSERITEFLNQVPQKIEWPNAAHNDTTFQLKVYDYLGNLQFDPGNTKVPPPGLSNHGFFVAGLIRLIAPNSQIHLIRVLGDNACGSVQTLIEAINAFMGAMHGKKIVINLSLGVRNLPSGAPLLEATLAAAKQSGAVIVAAAGNDSPGLASPVQAQEPASYDFVIGVVASNRGGKRSCYSNRAAPTPTNPAPNANNRDVAAPGGNGGRNPSGTGNCVSRTLTWTATPQPCTTGMRACGYGVVGLINPVKITTPPIRWRPKYGYWSGTSFSTPLVSGLAALAFQPTGATNTLVYCVIEKGAIPPPGTATPHPFLGAGVINVPRSLTIAASGSC